VHKKFRARSEVMLSIRNPSGVYVAITKDSVQVAFSGLGFVREMISNSIVSGCTSLDVTASVRTIVLLYGITIQVMSSESVP